MNDQLLEVDHEVDQPREIEVSWDKLENEARQIYSRWIHAA